MTDQRDNEAELKARVSLGSIKGPEDLWINTWLGVRFHPFRPTLDEVKTLDIVHATSNLCRFTGHCDVFYSVAEHQGLVAGIVRYLGGSELEVQGGAVHDAPEAYIVDLARPIKVHPGMAFYRETDAAVTAVVNQHFGLPAELPPIVKKADMLALALEAEVLMPRKPAPWLLPEITDELRDMFPIQALSPTEAKKQYMTLLATLFPMEVLKLPNYAPKPQYKFVGDIKKGCPVPHRFGRHSLRTEGSDVVCRECGARDVSALTRGAP